MPFRETIIVPPIVDMVNEAVIQEQKTKSKPRRDDDEEDEDEKVLEPGLVHMSTPNKKCHIQIQALPLPDEVTNILETNSSLLKAIHEWSVSKSETDSEQCVEKSVLSQITELKENLHKLFESAGSQWTDVIDHIWAFGPRRVGPNILVNKIPGYNRPCVWDLCNKDNQHLRDFDNSFVNGFQIATLSGPLCEEPMRGVCFVIEKWEYSDNSFLQTARLSESDAGVHVCDRMADISLQADPTDSGNEIETQKQNNDEGNTIDKSKSTKEEMSASISMLDGTPPPVSDTNLTGRYAYGPFSGQLISCIKAGCRKAFQTQPQRLMVAMYKCNIQSTTDVLGEL